LLDRHLVQGDSWIVYLADFALEIWGTVKFYIDYAQNKPGTRAVGAHLASASGPKRKADFGEAFGVYDSSDIDYANSEAIPMTKARHDED
jgi:hypothetical protein